MVIGYFAKPLFLAGKVASGRKFHDLFLASPAQPAQWSVIVGQSTAFFANIMANPMVQQTLGESVHFNQGTSSWQHPNQIKEFVNFY